MSTRCGNGAATMRPDAGRRSRAPRDGRKRFCNRRSQAWPAKVITSRTGESSMREKVATCHPDRRVHARGLCRPCYKTALVVTGKLSRRIPLCHPDRQHTGRGLCGTCYRKLYYRTTSGRAAIQAASVRNNLKRFGLSVSDYESLLHAQGGVCAICRGFWKSKHRLSVDHDHRTGEVRGLLCTACNNHLAWVENPEWMLRAKAYLDEPSRLAASATTDQVLSHIRN
jgi:recombination endonuclease VII